jgi:hypothetical protein
MVNENAMSSCQFILDTPITEGPDAFPSNINITLSTNTNSSINGLPTFDATVEGINSVPYFLLDFSNSNTVVWGAACVQGNGTTGLMMNSSCSVSPTNLSSSFNSSLASDIISMGNFTNMTFSGYQVSGNVWEN